MTKNLELSPAELSLFSDVTLTAARQASLIRNVSALRRLTVFCDLAASAAGDQVSIFPLISSKRADKPTAIEDVWYIAGVFDATPSAVLPSGTILAGADFTLTPEFGQVTIRPMEILSEVMDGASDEVRMTFSVDVTEAIWFHLQAADIAGSTVLNAVAVGSY